MVNVSTIAGALAAVPALLAQTGPRESELAAMGISGGSLCCFASVFLAWAGVFGGVGYAIGKNKDNGGLGFLLGFFFGFIGWIVVYMLDGRPKCTRCGNRVDRTASMCASCGVHFQR